MGQPQSISKAQPQSESQPIADTWSSEQSTSESQAQWEWQSNPNPWSSEQPEWTPYNPMTNHILEEAHKSNQKAIDLGDYVVLVSDKHIIQQNKKIATRQRPVRRILKQIEESKMGQEDLRKKRFYGIEPPKTYNKTFGSLKDFLLFFANRGPEIKNFVTILQEAEASQDLERLNKDILPQIVASIKEESTKVTDKTGEEKIIGLFEKTFVSFQEFYGTILKAYTIEGFLYKNMNRYLRTEDWTQLHCLLPYTYCLCKVFLQSELASVNNQPANDGKNDDKLILYRGMRLDEASLSQYEPQIASNFSWISVTSTSTNRKMAEMFMNNSKADDNKVPVMFIIEVSLSIENLPSTSWIDAKPFSDFPTEDEIILCPGSTFQLIDIRRNKNKAEVQLKLISDVGKLAHQGQIMHGAMHAETITGTIGQIYCLEKNELAEAIYYLKGNQLIENIEFNLCKFDTNTLTKLVDTIPTLPRLKRLKCFSVSSEDNTHLDIILKVLSQTEIDILEISDQLLEDEQHIILFAGGIKYLTSLTGLSLDFRGSKYITDGGVKSLCSDGLKHLVSLNTLLLDFSRCRDITDEGVKSLCSDGLKQLTSLKFLCLRFVDCCRITDKGVESLCSDGLKHLSSLLSLTLNFTNCYKIKDNGLKNLSCDGLKYLTSLIYLTLRFNQCWEIKDVGVESLCSVGLEHLTSLEDLDLHFEDCWQITAKGKELIKSWLDKVKNQNKTIDAEPIGVRRSQTYNFKRGKKDEILKGKKADNEKALNLAHTENKRKILLPKMLENGQVDYKVGIKSLISLTDLTLDFELCKSIQDQGVKSLCSDILNHLTSLTTLTINFENCYGITDEGVKSLCSNGLKHLTSLTALSLNFTSCYHITDVGVLSLCSDELMHLNSLKALTLNFKGCSRVSNAGFTKLKTRLKYFGFESDDSQGSP